MRTVLLLIILAVLLVGGAWWLSGLPGAFSLTVADTTITTSTPVALTLIGLLFLIIYVVIRFIAWLFSVPGRNRRWRDRRNRIRGDAAVNRALVALAADDASAARREAGRSRRLLGDTPVTLMLAAQAGRLAGREADAEAAYALLAEHRDGSLLGLRGLLRLAVQKQDWERATALASRAEAVHPGAAWLRDERRQVALRTRNWGEALRLSNQDNRAALAVAASEIAHDGPTGLRLARQAFEADPGLPPAAIAYATRLRAAGRTRSAQDVLRRAWATTPHPDIAAAYGHDAEDNLGRAQAIAELVRANPNHPESIIALGRADLEAGLANNARKQVERAREEGVNQRRLWVLLADIATLEGNPEEAQEALRHVADAEPDPVWRCTHCATVHGAWHPVCEACESTGTIKWGPPTEAAPHALRLPQPEPIDGLTS